ncbi:FBD-like protein [Artemisia annua]|uniref:FBD-like protein n=1 Tax=Artemisia annua TaxID=35608 RepID=A0A2U1LWW2_ARTAN|nr:FBD-like protein [Artemisia annua]
MSSTGEHVVDRLSSLPQDVLSDILSLMPTKFAVRTSLLSKRWRYTWTLVHSFDFKTTEDYNCSSYSRPEYVDWVLDHCKTSQVKIFRVLLDYGIPNSYCLQLISKVISLNVHELDIKHTNSISLPLSLLTCKTLTKLKLVSSGFWIPGPPFFWPSFVNLPNLKTLDVVLYGIYLGNALKLIHGCPVLENLYVEMGSWNGDDYSMVQTLKPLTLKVDHINLKRLTLKVHDTYSKLIANSIVLTLPNLEYFLFYGSMCIPFIIEEMSSLIEAKASCEVYHGDRLVQLLKGISQAKSISLITKHSLGGDDHWDLPKLFPNLKQLELEGYVGHKWNLIPQFLERSPNLEHLSIEKAYSYYWNKVKPIPACMRKLKTVKYTNGCYYHDLHFLKFILSHSRVLKTLTVDCCTKFYKPEEEDLELFRGKLTKLRKASRKCEIRFVGIWPADTLPVTHKQVQTRPNRVKRQAFFNNFLHYYNGSYAHCI